MKRKRQRTPKPVRDYSIMLALVEKAGEIPKRAYGREDFRSRGFKVQRSEIRKRRQEITSSPQFHQLPEAYKAIVLKAVKGKPVGEKVKAAKPVQGIKNAERVLHSEKARRLGLAQVVSLALQLPSKRQKSVLFSMPFKGDGFKGRAWEAIQKARSNRHAKAVRERLQEIVAKSRGSRRCQSIASQLMTVSPGIRQRLLQELNLPQVDLEHVSTILKAKRQEAMAIITQKKQIGLRFMKARIFQKGFARYSGPFKGLKAKEECANTPKKLWESFRNTQKAAKAGGSKPLQAAWMNFIPE